ncbi:hypothetical protein ZEAMMB73_Zm00001d019253 [Zea mays]|nr:hypothetical protein ZEAMMB73_Zm00001d019253 [Zea mays]
MEICILDQRQSKSVLKEEIDLLKVEPNEGEVLPEIWFCCGPVSGSRKKHLTTGRTRPNRSRTQLKATAVAMSQQECSLSDDEKQKESLLRE